MIPHATLEAYLKSKVFGGGGGALGSFFGDGSDGAFAPNLNIMTTAPNGGTVANLCDMNTGTVFTTGSLSAAADQVIFQIDFGTPQVLGGANPIYLAIVLWNFAISTGVARTLSFQWSDDAIAWTETQTKSVTTTNTVITSFNGTTAPHRYWRLVIKAGGSNCTFSCQGVSLNYTNSVGDDQTNLVWRILFPVAAHSGLVVKQYASITLPVGHIITTDFPCRGLVAYVQGNVNISGNPNMNQKAGLAPNGEIVPMVLTKENSSGVKTLEKYYQLTTVLQALRGGAGGNGGYGGSNTAGAFRPTGGTGGPGRINSGGFGGGGGGGGGGSSTNMGGNGGSIPYAELGGGQIITAGRAANGQYAVHGFSGSGGIGIITSIGNATSGKCNGGGGGGTGWVDGNATAFDGQFAGGFLALIVGGNITINPGGLISANGGNGGGGGATVGANNAGGGGGGGGSGGGVIAIFHKGIYTNNGAMQVNGGIGGAGGAPGNSGQFNETGGPGTSGSIGTILTQQIA